MSSYSHPAYVFSQAQHPGTVAAHNHTSLTNPVGSGRLILLGGVFISQVSAGAIPLVDPLRGWLATDVAGGTIEDISTIAKLKSTQPDPKGVIRTGDSVAITATLGAAWFNSPPLITTGAGSGAFVHQVPASLPGAGAITLRPGESTVLRTDSGDTDQRWNLSIAWLEVG
jgi:hypothetical protein